MIEISLPVILSIGATSLAGVVWSVRQEGRLNGHDALFIEREKQADKQHTDTVSRLARIEEKLDKIAYGSIRNV